MVGIMSDEKPSPLMKFFDAIFGAVVIYVLIHFLIKLW